MTYQFCYTVKKAFFGTIGAFILYAVQVSNAQSATVTLAWNANPEPNVAGYRLYYGTASHAYTQVVAAGNSTTASVPNLVAGTVYYFAATAYNTAGNESLFSSEVAYAPPSQTPAPSPTPGPTPASATIPWSS
jgi:fibronectin type 3 domain-containing protein